MDSTLAALTAWMPRQRWYADKARTPNLGIVASWEVTSDDLDAVVRTLLVSDDDDGRRVLYQVPVVERPAGSPTAHVIGPIADGAVLVDGPHDPAYARALLRAVAPEPVPADQVSASVLSGEQSNTSIIYAGPRPVICKVFRQVHAGLNPDIELQSALARAGSRFVPRVVGALEGHWQEGSETVTGSLAFAQEYLSGVEDAWRVAVRAAAAGEDFTRRAHELGLATADVHADLARLFPTVPAGPAQRDAIAGAWRRRLGIAAAEVPGLAPAASAIAATYARALEADWPALQRVHGDFHLGQVLQAPGRGWVLLDFEGEPMRPIAERRLPDLAARDVAGMLRSFDYVAGSLALAGDDAVTPVAQQWARHAREAFLAGYSESSAAAPSAALLDALELDKAVYEAIYEARNRPDWITIPLRAIARLVTS